MSGHVWSHDNSGFVVLLHHLETLRFESAIDEFSGDPGGENRVAQAGGAVGITMVVDVAAVDVVRLAVEGDREITAIAGKSELTLPAGGIDDSVFKDDGGCARDVGLPGVFGLATTKASNRQGDGYEKNSMHGRSFRQR